MLRTIRPVGQVLTKQVQVPVVSAFGTRRGNAELAAKREAQNPKILITGISPFFFYLFYTNINLQLNIKMNLGKLRYGTENLGNKKINKRLILNVNLKLEIKIINW